MRGASGPLSGIRVLEVGGIGPAPFGCMLLADLGAEVIRIDRPPGYDGGSQVDAQFDLLLRSRRNLALNLKCETAVEIVLELAKRSDVVIEGFRPGVAERLGIGPDDCFAANPALVYGRMTGWGQDGPMAQEPGHDVNYISLTGALHAIGPAGSAPVIPLNLVGDFGGGALYLALGVLAAVIEARQSGRGQVVDTAMVDGAASLMTLFFGLLPAGAWDDKRGANRLDSGAPYYNVYETKDGRWISLGANEARFWRNALEFLGIAETEFPGQQDRAQWPMMRERLAAVFRTRTRDDWVAAAVGRQVCLAPVLSLSEAPQDPHLRARGTFVEVDGLVQPAPAPRFSRTPGAIRCPPADHGAHTDEILQEIGYSAQDVRRLRDERVVG